VGVKVTWKSRGVGGTSATGYPGKVPVFTPSTITVSLQPLQITDKLLDLGRITNDQRSIICKYTDAVKLTDEIVWNGDTFEVDAVQDVSAFGDSVNPGAGDVLVYLVKIKRSPTGA
jgi:hypothetical protein